MKPLRRPVALKPAFALAVLFASSGLAGCEEEQAVLSPLVGGWRLVQMEYATPETAWSIQEAACHADDVFEYKRGGSYVQYPGAVPCGSSSAPITGDWSLLSDDTTIRLRYDDFAGDYFSEIEELTDDRLVIVFETGGLDGGRFRYTQARAW